MLSSAVGAPKDVDRHRLVIPSVEKACGEMTPVLLRACDALSVPPRPQRHWVEIAKPAMMKAKPTMRFQLLRAGIGSALFVT